MMRGRVLAVLGLLAGCAGEPLPPTTIDPVVLRSTLHYAREYILQAGDALEISVFHVPDYNRSVTIRADGYVSLPVVGEVKLAGLSVPEGEKVLADKLASRLVDPDVTVNVTNPRPASVYVLGEVARPGATPLRDSPTAALAVANSGGILRSAAYDYAAVIHLGTDGVLTGTIIPRPGTGETAFYTALAKIALDNGDMVVVPESTRSQASRFIQDFINTPLTGVNQALTPYLEFRIINR